ncbi:uncharacterized protein LOC128394629 [Panonychus citri]|uniref:uncharacterized protein LOC128394629 n=1 Tax=Panonychus citri TaxID=50023 RepID=UPI002307ADDC|nr:uncharacterized protein LOC128394629 [Panonychus citri]
MIMNKCTYKSVIKMIKIDQLVLIIFLVFFTQLINCFPSSPTELESIQFCPPNWKFIKSSYKCIYFDRTQKGNFEENEKFCRSENLNSSMLVIDSSDESEQVNKLIRDSSISRCWLGGKTIQSHGGGKQANLTIVWSPRKMTNYTNWAPKSPNCLSSPFCCVTINSRSWWTDINCQANAVMICEKSAIKSTRSEIVSYFTQLLQQIDSSNYSEIINSNLTEIVPKTAEYDSSSSPFNSMVLIAEIQQKQLEMIKFIVFLINDLNNLIQSRNQDEPINSTTDSIISQLNDQLKQSIFGTEIWLIVAVIGLTVIVIIIVLIKIIKCYHNRSAKKRRPEQLLPNSVQWPCHQNDSAYGFQLD